MFTTRTLHVVTLFTLLTCVGCGKGSGSQRLLSEPPAPFPADLTDAWTHAGGEVGWISATDPNSIHEWFREDRVETKDELAGFRFREWKDGALAKLPQPQRPFGLALMFAGLTDANLKELPVLDKLESLYLVAPKVTDEGLKELAKIKGIRYLAIFSEYMTDEGLEVLAGLPQLRRYCQ